MSTLQQAVQIAAAAPTYGTGGVRQWLQDNVVTVLGILIGVVVLMGAMKANASKVIMVFGLGIVGMFWLGLAASGNTAQVGTWLVGLFTTG